MSQVKALVLFSGGLDSMLAAKVLEEQGVDIQPLCFNSIFFSCTRAEKIAANFGWKLKVIDISQGILKLVKNPPSGYGKNLNPCLDCHALMIKKAGEYLTPNPSPRQERGTNPLASRKVGEVYDLIATGEVLGQRPFSQNREALAQVAKLAGVEILRPLSAKLLPLTQAEKSGLINRHRLLDIKCRSRQRQLELVEKYKIKEYSSPAGGCLLTDQEFSQRLMKMLGWWPECTINDVSLLKYGRIFWLSLTPSPSPAPGVAGEGGKVLLVVGRNEKENEQLEKIAQTGDIILELKDEMGPITIVRIKNYELRITNEMREIDVPKELKMSELKMGAEKNQEEIVNIAALLTGYYATKARGKRVKIKIKLIEKDIKKRNNNYLINKFS